VESLADLEPDLNGDPAQQLPLRFATDTPSPAFAIS